MAKNKVSKDKDNAPVKYLEIISTNHCHSWRDDGEWAPWGCDNDYHITGCKLHTGKGYYDLLVDFEVERGDTVYVVVCTYGAGDSFGHESGRVHYEAVFKDAKKAFKCHDAMYEARKKYDGGRGKYPDVSYISESGKEIKQSCISFPFCGYFESLDSVEVKALIVS